MSDVDRGIETAEERTPGGAAGWPVPDYRGGDWFAPYRLRLAAAFEREMEAGRGFLWLPVLFGIGIILYFALPAEPSLVALAAVTGALASLAWALRRRVAAGRVTVALLVIAAGATTMTLRTAVVAAPVLSREITAEVTGWVAKREATAGGGARLRVAVHDIAGLAQARTPAAVRITVRSRADGIRVGDAVTILARLRPPSGPVMPGGYDFGRVDYYAGIGAVGFAYGAARPAAIGPPPFWIALAKPLADLRETIRTRVVEVLPGDRGEIAAALIMGDQRGISEQTQDEMRASGLTHVLSISGLHMALVAGSAFWLIRAILALSPGLSLIHPIKKWAAAGALGVATFYLAISGLGVATERSYIMLAVMLAAVMLGRRAITVRNVAIAAFIVLLYAPESILSASFQMSFAATLALVVGYEAVSSRVDRRTDLAAGHASRFWIWAVGLVMASLLAGLATTPFAIYHFQRAAPLTLLANVAAMPVVDLIVMPMALFAVVLMPFGLEALPLAPMGWGIEWMMLVARTVAGWSVGWGGVPAISLLSLLFVVAGFLWLGLWRERWRVLGIVPMVLALPVAAATPSPDILIDAGGETVAVRGIDGRYEIVNPKANRFAAENWLRADADSRGLDDIAADGVACDEAGCVARFRDGTRIAVGASPAAFEDDCRRAAVVVSRHRAPPWCRDSAMVIDRNALAAGGAHALYAIPGAAPGSPRFLVETAYPPGPRRPFMPPVQ